MCLKCADVSHMEIGGNNNIYNSRHSKCERRALVSSSAARAAMSSKGHPENTHKKAEKRSVKNYKIPAVFDSNFPNVENFCQLTLAYLFIIYEFAFWTT